MSTARIDKSNVTAQGGVQELYIDGVKTAPAFLLAFRLSFRQGVYGGISKKPLNMLDSLYFLVFFFNRSTAPSILTVPASPIHAIGA